MAITADDFRRHYESLPDDALLEIDPGELVPAAHACLAAELARRGLETNPSGADESVAGAASPGLDSAQAPEEERVCITEYDYPDEADLARGLLEAAEIPVSLESEPGVVRLMVPASLAEQALRMLITPLSDEELEAQAEAAGFEDEGEEDESEEDEDEGDNAAEDDSAEQVPAGSRKMKDPGK